jgi:tetratricopeptide (TPR) repeat protein
MAFPSSAPVTIPSKSGERRLLARIRVLLFIALALAGFALASATECQAGARGPPHNISELVQRGEHYLEEGRSVLEEPALTMARQSFEECVRIDSNNARCFYDLARTHSYLAKVEEAQNRKDAAQRWVDSAIENAKRSVGCNDQSADGHALLADLYGTKIGLGGAFTGMRYGPKANEETHRAFELDANNPLAYAAIGRKFLYAPKMFGGDVDKAIESFHKATEFDPSSDEAFVWLAIAYRKKGDAASALAAVAKALQLNGRSVFAKRIGSGAANFWDLRK